MAKKKIKKVLIVDDCPNDTLLVTGLLERSFRSKIHTVNSIKEAKVMLLSERFDIVTLDGRLPCLLTGGFGHRLVPLIKENQSTDCKIIMISGERQYLDAGIEIGAHAAISKYDIQESIKLNHLFQLVPHVSIT
ncbi:MAG: response regulator [candidate division SR1 bacterium]|nr:response regulator [candidate division SR1 bacterium]